MNGLPRKAKMTPSHGGETEHFHLIIPALLYKSAGLGDLLHAIGEDAWIQIDERWNMSFLIAPDSQAPGDSVYVQVSSLVQCLTKVQE